MRGFTDKVDSGYTAIKCELLVYNKLNIINIFLNITFINLN